MAIALTNAQTASRDLPRETLAFYDREAESYCRSTRAKDLTRLYPRLLDHVAPGGLILDAGSGSGRDTRFFLDCGYRVEAFDASASMAALATELTGVEVAVDRFETWNGPAARYDAVWAFASLLHVARAELPGALARLARSLRPGGHLFASFKWGTSDRLDGLGRHYTNMTLGTARSLIEGTRDFACVDVWRERGPSGLGDDASWVYVLARRER